MANLINENLKKKAALVLDGAMATELEKRGVHTDNALWSATALIDNPEAVKAVHKSDFEAGADIAITDTYQANVNGFEQAGYSEGQSEKLITEAVRLARAARDEFYFELPADERPIGHRIRLLPEVSALTVLIWPMAVNIRAIIF